MSEAAERRDGSCSNPDCGVAEGGQCVEGLELKDCPHFGPTRDEVEEQGTGEPVAANDTIRLPSAAVLNFEGASRVLRSVDARIVAVLGPTESGKTSLIAGVYEVFQRSAVGNLEFSRSETLHAFERICHEARAASRRRVPHMVRTPVGSVAFFHLELAREGQVIPLLLADRSGEEYRSAADDVRVTEGFAEIGRADSVSILVDGEKLLSGDRHNLGSEVKLMLQALKDGNGLSNEVALAVVLTKLDAVESSEERDRGAGAFERLVREIRRLFAGSFSTIEEFRVAASPKTSGAVKGEGLEELLEFWLTSRRVVPTERVEAPLPSRAFGKLRGVEAGENDGL